MSIQFIEIANADDFLSPDSGIEVAHIWDDGTTLWALAGGQSGGWGIDRAVWVYDNLPGGPHAEKDYSGFWAMTPTPPSIIAANLRVQNAQLETTPRGWPLYRVPIDADEIISVWESYDRSDGNAKSARWQTEVYIAQSGALIGDFEGTNPFYTLGDLANAMLIRVRAVGAPRGNYSWPPPNYATIANEPTAQPARYSWQHPTTGAFYFYDPRFNVGAKPYSLDFEDQRAILEEAAQLETDGQQRKIKEWVSFLIEFDENGEQLRADAEWSVIRVVRGDAQWNETVAPQCTTPALWRAPLDRVTLQTNAPFEIWSVDAALRSVGALATDVDGSLLIGGACSGQSGPLPALFQLQPQTDVAGTDVAGDEARGEASASLFYCECAQSLGKSLHDVVRHRAGETDSQLRAVSPCDNFRHDMTRVPAKRLIPSHPGGRNLQSWPNDLGWHLLFSTEAADFATDPQGKHKLSNSFLLLSDNGAFKVGAPLGKQLDSQLAVYGGRVMGVEDETARAFLDGGIDPDNLGLQHLGASETGEVWKHLVSWDKGQFDGGVVTRWGNKTDGNALWCLGTTAKPAQAPRAYCLQGTQITRNVQTSHFVQRAQSVTHDSIERMIGVGMPYDAQSGYSRQQRIILSPGDSNGNGGTRVCAFWDEASQAFQMTRNTFTQAGGTLARLAPFYAWVGGLSGNGGGQWVASQSEPAYPYLETETTDFLLTFQLSGVMPYNSALFDALCFTIGADGSVSGPFVDTTSGNAADVLDLMPPGTRVSVVKLDNLERALAAVGLNADLRNGGGVPAYFYESLYPAFWLRADSETPFQLQSGQTLTGEQRAQLAQFDLRARLNVDRFLPLEAQTRVEAVILLAPDWTIESSELKPRF